jgi:hypothetical protein
MYKIKRLSFTAFVFLSMTFQAQTGLAAEGFGFGDNETEGTNATVSTVPAVSVGGEIAASLLDYIDDFKDGAGSVRFGDVFSGKLNFTAETAYADGVLNLKLAPGPVYYDEKSPVYVDEAYVRAYFGNFNIEGGLRKLTWGKADSMGPLDVINPLDYSNLALLVDQLSDSLTLKIARPLVHVSWNTGSFSKLEGVFVPYYKGHRFAVEGRWTPAQLVNLDTQLSNLPPSVTVTRNEADTSTLDYAQAGLRWTATIGSADLGVQYYYGRLPQPSFSFSFNSTPIGPVPSALNIDYNRYHQIGLDYAQVIAGFNVRAELATNLTDDLDGDDGSVYNPSLAWSLGFDRDLFWGINLNLQSVETITLFHNKIGDNPMLDFEAGSHTTSTRITAKLSKSFFQDKLTFSFAALWGIEDKDCLVMPVLSWTRGDVTTELSGGIFAGDEEGQFGQYHKNNFVRLRLKYVF